MNELCCGLVCALAIASHLGFGIVTLSAMGFAADLRLAVDGQTTYQIVKPQSSSEVDDYAVSGLAKYLKQMTGAEFPVARPDEMDAGRDCIFMGMSEPAARWLGEDPLAELADQEHVAKNIGQNIFLYGKGIHGNFQAARVFLEHLGWRWYTRFSEPTIPRRETLVVHPFELKRGSSFLYRGIYPWNQDFYFWNGMNMGDQGSPVLTSPSVQSFLDFIPPNPQAPRRKFEWLENKDYFTTNPEFFTLSAEGHRVDNKQLCFSNPDLRRDWIAGIWFQASPGLRRWKVR